MTRYRDCLPQSSDTIFITDGGLETTLIFHQGYELADFAAFDLLQNEIGYQGLQQYFRTYLDLARTYNVGLILESPTWRASADWGTRLGYSPSALAEANHQSIELLQLLRDEYETESTPIVISGCIGPRGDGYNPTDFMSETEAENYHRSQIETFRETAADLVTAMTINYIEEAVGIVRAARSNHLPVVISFTVETDGKLPTGQTLSEAIERIDTATDRAPAYYMINCAHPTHFADVLGSDDPYLDRIRGIRANSSRKSHAELNDSPELDEGNPEELGEQYREMRNRSERINVLGGCCGTDTRHIEAICKACLPLAWSHLSGRLPATI